MEVMKRGWFRKRKETKELITWISMDDMDKYGTRKRENGEEIQSDRAGFESWLIRKLPPLVVFLSLFVIKDAKHD